jgi:2-keto-4-pentenoate hydratase/2-oxohepta-3-ene-1,7-dioic acid hydratase in catechol pathway
MKIICVGRNYAEHAAELNNPIPTSPLLFMKPATAVLRDGKPFYYPDFSKDIHHEIEIVVKISKSGKHIEPKFAHKYYQEISVGIDFTARDLQEECKKKGQPWEIAKAFDHSAVLGEFLPLAEAERDEAGNFAFSLLKNDVVVQSGSSGDMITGIDGLIAYASKFFTLQVGDLLFTGTPKGVSAVQIGDQLTGLLGSKVLLQCSIK